MWTSRSKSSNKYSKNKASLSRSVTRERKRKSTSRSPDNKDIDIINKLRDSLKIHTESFIQD